MTAPCSYSRRMGGRRPGAGHRPIVAAIDQEPARAGLLHFPESDLLLALHSIPAAERWVIGQAFHSRPFLIQTLFDKPTLKVRKIGLKQSSISDDVAIMCTQTGELLVDHRRHLKYKDKENSLEANALRHSSRPILPRMAPTRIDHFGVSPVGAGRPVSSESVARRAAYLVPGPKGARRRLPTKVAFTEAAIIRSPLNSKANLSSARLRVTSWHAIISLS